MNRLTVMLIAALLAGGLQTMRAQQNTQSEKLLASAQHRATIDGDLKGAIEEYKKIVAGAGGNRTLAAQALVQMAECYQKLGDAESRTIYERVMREFADQAESAANARARLAALRLPAVPDAARATRLMWTGVEMTEAEVGLPSADGRYLSFTADNTGDLAVRDMREGTTRLLTHNGRWIDQYAEGSVLSPDGRQVAYAWWDIENEKPACCGYDLRILPVSASEGGKPQIVHRSVETRYVRPFGWTADARGLLVLRQLQDLTYQIARISIADGSVGVLKSLEWRRPRRISLSPDGRSIAYDAPASADVPARDIFLLAADGSRETVVVQHAADDQQPVWSPDGSQIFFVSNRTGTNSVWTVHVDAGNARGSAELVKPDISRLVGMTRSGALYYLTGGPISNIYTVDVDANVKAKTAPSMVSDRFVNSNTTPAWSRDGQYLAYYSVRAPFPDSPGWAVLVIRTVKTGEERQVPAGLLPAGGLLTAGSGSGPMPVRWFPDGRSVLVVARDAERNRLGYYKVDTASGNAEPLLFVKSARRSDLSSDGKSIFYVDPGDASATATSRLMRFDLDSRRETALKDARGGGFSTLAVSPDGTLLAYLVSARDPAVVTPTTSPSRLEVMPVGGGQSREVYRIPDTGGGPARGILAWTPDQRYLLFATDGNKLEELWRIPVTGGEPERTGVSVRGFLRSPGMHPDGHRLTFGSVEDGAHELWALENFLPPLSGKK